MILDLDEREVDFICESLSFRPWREVNGLLQKIVQQANMQRSNEIQRGNGVDNPSSQKEIQYADSHQSVQGP